MVARNMWNFYSHKYYDKKLFEKFCRIIEKNSAKTKVGVVDIPNIL